MKFSTTLLFLSVLVSATTVIASGWENGSACKDSSDCSSGSCQYSKCADKLYDGAPCYKDNMCSGGQCTWVRGVPNTCTGSGTQAPLKNGKYCKTSDQCKSNSCQYGKCADKLQDGKQCYKDSMCNSDACTSDGDNPWKCSGGTTGALLKNGKYCTTNNVCASGSCQKLKCADKAKNYETCYKDNMCKSDKCRSTRLGRICLPSGVTASSVTNTTATS